MRAQNRSLRYLSGLPDRGAPGLDHFHEFVPRFHERFGAFILKLSGQRVDINSGLGELREYFLAIPAVGGQDRAEFGVLRKGLQSGFRDLGRDVNGRSLTDKGCISTPRRVLFPSC